MLQNDAETCFLRPLGLHVALCLKERIYVLDRIDFPVLSWKPVCMIETVIWNTESEINAIYARVWWDADIWHGVKGASQLLRRRTEFEYVTTMSRLGSPRALAGLLGNVLWTCRGRLGGC
jgi:hypothetical protein